MQNIYPQTVVHSITQFVEEEFQARNIHQHIQHCAYIDQPGISKAERQHYSKVYGVNRRSILCDLPSFNVTQQLPQDLMHVLFEGVSSSYERAFKVSSRGIVLHAYDLGWYQQSNIVLSLCLFWGKACTIDHFWYPWKPIRYIYGVHISW